MTVLLLMKSCQKQQYGLLGNSPGRFRTMPMTSTLENEVSTIGSIRTLFERLEGELEDTECYHIFYRGQSDKKYGLLPSIYREETLIQNEDKIFRDIIAQCPPDFKGSHRPLKNW